MIAPLTAISAILVMMSLALYGYSRLVEERPGPVADRVHSLNRAVLVGIFAGDAAVGVVSVLFLDELRTTADTISARTGAVGLWVATGGIVLIVSLMSLCGYLAIAPAIRRMRGLGETSIRGAATFARALTLFLIPLSLWLVALLVLSAIARDNTVALILGRVALVAFLVALGPLFVRVALPTYSADDATRKYPLEICAQHGLRLRGVRLYRSRGQRQANALFVGILPRHRYVYVSDYLLDNFRGRELEAIMAHEIAHGKEHHLLIRVGLFGVAILIGLVPFGGLVSLVIILYLMFGLGIRLEKRADDYVARTVGSAEMTQALRRLAELNDTPLHTGRLWNSLTMHPGIAQRIARLGGQLSENERARGGAVKADRRRRSWLARCACRVSG